MVALVKQATPADLTFPKKRVGLVEALDNAISASLAQQGPHKVEWRINDFYLKGARKILVTDWETGAVEVVWEGDDAETSFRYERVLEQYRTEMGRLLRMNTDPVVTGQGFGLSSVRDGGIGQATLTYMASRADYHGRKRGFARLLSMLLKYGTAGLGHYRRRGRDFGDRTAMRPIAPWELLPLPAEPDTLEDLRGIVRRRPMPLQQAYRLGLIPDRTSTEDLKILDIPYGQSPDGVGGAEGNWDEATEIKSRGRSMSEAGTPIGGLTGGPGGDDRGCDRWVIVEEGFLFTEPEIVGRYLVKVGRTVPFDESYENNPVVCPIGLSHYVPTEGFYGRSFVGPLLSINYQVERMLGTQFRVVADFDEFSCIVIPMDAGLNVRQVEKRERRKVLRVQSDPLDPKNKPYLLEPATPGDFPMKTAGMGVQLQQDMAGQGTIYGADAPGRVDSAAALGFLHEVGNVGLVACVNSIADAHVQVYAGMLQVARREIEQARRTGNTTGFKVPMLSDEMIGVVVDPTSGTVSLDANPIPPPENVLIDVRERALASKEQEKQEAGLMLQSGLITPAQFRILNIKNNWGFPQLDRSDFNAWRKAVVCKILLFNDGVTPGQMIGGSEYDRTDIMLAVFAEFMSSLEFAVASPEVKDAFMDWRDQFMALVPRFPEQLPDVTAQPGAGPGAGATMGGPRLAAPAA